MAKIFAVQGAEQRGQALAELPWPTCRELFNIDEMCATEDQPKFGDRNEANIFPTRIVVQIGEDEARQHDLGARYFASPLQVEKARAALNMYLERL
jgi:hypothetical protein